MRDRVPQSFVLCKRRFAGFQNSRILAQRFCIGVIRNLGELGIDVFDVAIFIGDDDRYRALLHRARKLAQLVFRTLAFGNVATSAADPVPFFGFDRKSRLQNDCLRTVGAVYSCLKGFIHK